MLPRMQIQRPLRAKGSHARGKSADDLPHSSVDHQEVVYHPLVSGAVNATDWTTAFPLIDFQMLEQVRPVDIVHFVEALVTNAASL